MAYEARDQGKPLSIALLGNAAEVHHELLKRDVKIDIVTDQTSAHDPLNGYVPVGYSFEEATELTQTGPESLHSPFTKKHGETRRSDARIPT